MYRPNQDAIVPADAARMGQVQPLPAQGNQFRHDAGRLLLYTLVQDGLSDH